MKVTAQYKIPEKPRFVPSLIDSTRTLSGKEFYNLKTKLEKYQRQTSTEILVVIIPSLQGEEVKFLAAQWAHKWGLGQKGKDNGVFVLLAKNDRKIAISTGYGTEHLLTDQLSKRIIEAVILPRFKSEDFYGGLDAGTAAIMSVLQGEFQADKKRQKQGSSRYKGLLIVLIVVGFFMFSNRTKGGKGGGRYFRDEPPEDGGGGKNDGDDDCDVYE